MHAKFHVWSKLTYVYQLIYVCQSGFRFCSKLIYIYVYKLNVFSLLWASWPEFGFDCWFESLGPPERFFGSNPLSDWLPSLQGRNQTVWNYSEVHELYWGWLLKCALTILKVTRKHWRMPNQTFKQCLMGVDKMCADKMCAEQTGIFNFISYKQIMF